MFPHNTTPYHNIPYHTIPHPSHHTRTAIICRSPQTNCPELSWGPIQAKRDFHQMGTPNHIKPHHSTPHHTTIYHTISQYAIAPHPTPIPSHAHRHSGPIAPNNHAGALAGGRFRQTAIFHTTPNHQTILNHTKPHHTTPYPHTIPHQEW